MLTAVKNLPTQHLVDFSEGKKLASRNVGPPVVA